MKDLIMQIFCSHVPNIFPWRLIILMYMYIYVMCMYLYMWSYMYMGRWIIAARAPWNPATHSLHHTVLTCYMTQTNILNKSGTHLGVEPVTYSTANRHQLKPTGSPGYLLAKHRQSHHLHSSGEMPLNSSSRCLLVHFSDRTGDRSVGAKVFLLAPGRLAFGNSLQTALVIQANST